MRIAELHLDSSSETYIFRAGDNGMFALNGFE